jgi:hypothetical protein
MASKKPQPITVNLDQASRATVVTAACCMLHQAGAHAWDIREWRARAAEWDHLELLRRAAELGVRYVRGNQPWALPHQ